MFSNLFCYICLKKLKLCKTSIRTQNATHTETPLKTYLEQFDEQFPLTEDELDEIVLCEECLSKINDYDLACLTARNIENDLRNLLQKSKALTVKPEVIIKEESNDVIENEFQGDNNDGLFSSSDDETPLNEIKKNTQLKVVRKRPSKTRKKAKYPKNKTTSQGSKTDKLKHCAICGFKTNYIHTMEHHMRKLHINEKQEIVYRCLKCRMTFSSQSDLDAHMDKHEKLIPQNPLQCVECGKILSSVSSLYNHIPLHTGNFRMFVCELCGREFNHQKSFRRHKLAHANVNTKTKACPTCGRYFSETSSLARHLRTHTGEKPYACSVCDRRFANPYNMKSHMKLMHREKTDQSASKMHICIVCNRGFPQALLLQGHLKRSHQLVMDD